MFQKKNLGAATTNMQQDDQATRSGNDVSLSTMIEILIIILHMNCKFLHSGLLHLYGERLNDWDTAIVLAEGALAIEQFHPLLRIEAHRLLGRAHAAQGRAGMARKAAERAADEAADARYAWLEAMSLGDALKWCGASEAQDIRKRLRSVAARLSASLKELGLDDL